MAASLAQLVPLVSDNDMLEHACLLPEMSDSRGCLNGDTTPAGSVKSDVPLGLQRKEEQTIAVSETCRNDDAPAVEELSDLQPFANAMWQPLTCSQWGMVVRKENQQQQHLMQQQPQPHDCRDSFTPEEWLLLADLEDVMRGLGHTVGDLRDRITRTVLSERTAKDAPT